MKPRLHALWPVALPLVACASHGPPALDRPRVVESRRLRLVAEDEPACPGKADDLAAIASFLDPFLEEQGREWEVPASVRREVVVLSSERAVSDTWRQHGGARACSGFYCQECGQCAVALVRHWSPARRQESLETALLTGLNGPSWTVAAAVIAHELAHAGQLEACAARPQALPGWLSEGLAQRASLWVTDRLLGRLPLSHDAAQLRAQGPFGLALLVMAGRPVCAGPEEDPLASVGWEHRDHYELNAGLCEALELLRPGLPREYAVAGGPALVGLDLDGPLRAAALQVAARRLADYFLDPRVLDPRLDVAGSLAALLEAWLERPPATEARIPERLRLGLAGLEEVGRGVRPWPRPLTARSAGERALLSGRAAHVAQHLLGGGPGRRLVRDTLGEPLDVAR